MYVYIYRIVLHIQKNINQLTEIVRLYHQLAQNEQENNRQHGDMNHSSLRQHQLSS